MSRLYFADIERPLTETILTNWSRLIAHGRSALRIPCTSPSALRIPCTRTVCTSTRRGVVRGTDAYRKASKRDLRRQALECTKLPNMFGSAANRFPPRKFCDSETMPRKQFFLTGTALRTNRVAQTVVVSTRRKISLVRHETIRHDLWPAELEWKNDIIFPPTIKGISFMISNCFLVPKVAIIFAHHAPMGVQINFQGTPV
jgi:hypothetical protein